MSAAGMTCFPATGRMPGWPRRVLGWAVLLHFAATALWMVPGHFSVDEVGYHWMTKSVAGGWPWYIDNGYEQIPSAELQVAVASTIKAVGGHLHGKFPLGFPLLAAPLYRWIGFRALFVLNAAAFAVVLLLTWRLACRYLEPFWALAACAIWGLATFSWEYSQGAWPHMTALAFSLGGYVLALETAGCAGRQASAAWRALGTGLLLGAGMTVRLDGALFLAAAGLVFLFARPSRFANAAWMLAGTGPAFLALAWDNHRKYGVWQVFSYGPGAIGLRRFQTLALVLLGAGAVALCAHVWKGGSLRRKPGALAAVVLLVCAGLFALGVGPRRLGATLRNSYAVIADMSAMDPQRMEAGMTRTMSGGVRYLGQFKKAVLQSTPYLGLLLAYAWRRLSATDRKPFAPLFLPILALALAYGPTAWHGGLCLNQRYFLPVFPFTSVLTALVLRDLLGEAATRVRRGAPIGWLASLVLVFLLCMAVYAFLAVPPEPFLMRFPLALSVLVAACTVLFYAGPWQGRAFIRATAAAGVGAALGWSAATAFGYDLYAAAQRRKANLHISQTVMPQVERGSLLFVPVFDPFAGLIDRGVRLANPWQDDFQSFRLLIRHHLGKGARVFVATFGRPHLEELRSEGRLDGLLWSERLCANGFLILEINAIERES